MRVPGVMRNKLITRITFALSHFDKLIPLTGSSVRNTRYYSRSCDFSRASITRYACALIRDTAILLLCIVYTRDMRLVSTIVLASQHKSRAPPHGSMRVFLRNYTEKPVILTQAHAARYRIHNGRRSGTSLLRIIEYATNRFPTGRYS